MYPSLHFCLACRSPPTVVGPRVCSRSSRSAAKGRRHKKVAIYGAYNRLLGYCFGDSFTFYVAPQHPPSDLQHRDVFDFVVLLIVFDSDSRPVLVAEIKDDGWAKRAHTRLEADEQLRRRYDSMLHDCPIPHLWGLSLLGTSARIYCGQVVTGAVTPPRQARPRDDYVLPPEFLAGQWSLDILSMEGFNKMKEIVADITTTVDAL